MSKETLKKFNETVREFDFERLHAMQDLAISSYMIYKKEKQYKEAGEVYLRGLFCEFALDRLNSIIEDSTSDNEEFFLEVFKYLAIIDVLKGLLKGE